MRVIPGGILQDTFDWFRFVFCLLTSFATRPDSLSDSLTRRRSKKSSSVFLLSVSSLEGFLDLFQAVCELLLAFLDRDLDLSLFPELLLRGRG